MTNTIAAANYYADLGWHIFPIRPQQKKPLVKWSTDSTTDPDQIRRWWQRWPNANIGIDCGRSDLLVIDVDSYKSDCGDLTDWLSLDDQETVTALTPSGGQHLIYQRNGLRLGNSVRGLPPGIDIRAQGGYIVAAPSVGKHDRKYRYLDGYGPHEMALRPVSDLLVSILHEPEPLTLSPRIDAVQRSAEIVAEVLDRGDIDYRGPLGYRGGLRWLLNRCPFMPDGNEHGNDQASFALVFADGRISAGCHHNRCRQRIGGWRGWDVLKRLTAAH